MAWKAGSAAALRAQKEKDRHQNQETTAASTPAKATQTSTAAGGWAKGSAAALREQKQTEAANIDLTSKAFDEYRANNNLGFADEMDSRRDWADGRALSAPRPADTGASRSSPEVGALLQRTPQSTSQTDPRWGAAAMDALSPEAKWGLPTQNVLEKTDSGAVAYGDSPAQKLKGSYTPYLQKDEFDRLNEWFDQPRNQELVGKLLEQKSGFTTYAEQGTSRNAASAGDGSIDPFRTAAGKSQSGAKYTDDDLRKQGYSAAEIAQARDYLTQYDAIPEWKKQARRAGNTIGGIADSVAGSAVMTGETAVQSAKNIADTQKNWAKVQQEIKGDERAERLFQLLTDVDMDYNPVYPESRNRDLVLMGYGSEEIREMRDRLAGLEVNDGIDPKTSVGYQLYKRGQELTGAAQSGLTEGSRAVQGAVSSAAENLAVSSINPAAVLPVLSLQGAGDAMGQSIEKGESAGKTLAGGALKFGAGWGINSVGAADLAKTMGSDYAKDTLAGQIAAKIQSLVGDAPFAKAHPTVAAALSGGIDNAMQAFVESYADKAIDAALGDEKAAQSLFTTDTLIAALESGLSGGASGAMGGAVGSALAKYNDGNASLLGQAEYYDQLDNYEKAVAAEKKRQQRVEEPGMASEQQTAQEAAKADSGLALSGDSRQIPQSGSPWQDGGAVRNEQSSTAQKSEGSATEGNGIKYSIRTDDDGKQYVQIDDDLLGNVPEENWKNTVRDAIRNLYPNGFERDGQTISNTREGRGEFTHSKYTRGLERVSSDTYADKMRMASNLDEVVSTSGPVENEQANHKNAESFNRGNINIRIGTKDYNADVLTAIKQDGREVFYDVVNIQPTTIKAPTETAEAKASGNRSMGADEISRRTDAESAASDGRGQPGISKTSIAPETARVNEKGVEKAGETVETAATEGRDYADVDLKVDPAGLDAADWNRNEQKAAARELVNRAQMSTKAAQAVVDAMPQGVGAAVYAQAANSLYRMGVMQDVTFEKALELTGSGSLGGATGQVLALGEIGENALRIAYTYGKGEAEAYNAKKVSEISSGGGVVNKDAGAYYVGDTVRSGQNADDAFIELGAKSSGTAVHRMMEGLRSGAKGFLQTAAGRIYLSGEAGSETMMHETFHALNEWSPETGQAVMDRLMKYLVEANGMESTEKLVQSYLDKYAASGQKVTYNQALEEVTADAMETVFGDAESFRDFVRQQAAEAKMNAKARGAIGKVMEKIENLLQTVLKDVEHFLKKEPTNAAAKAAKSLTEEQLRDLRELYFEHQAEAGAKYREAVAENKTALSETKEAAVKYSLPDMAKETEAEKTERQMALTIHPAQTNAERTARVSETNWSGQNTQDARKALQGILKEFGIIGKTYTEKTLEIEYEYRTKTVRESANHQAKLTGREYGDMALVHANIEEVLDAAVPLEAHTDKKGKPHVEGMIVLASALQDGERIIPVRAELKLYDNEPTALYLAIAETQDKQKRTGSQMEESTQKDTRQPSTGSSNITITDFYNLVKHDANFAKYFSDEVAYKAEGLDTLQEESKALESQRRDLKEERANWMNSDEVKAIEAKKKSYGIFSAEGKAYRESAEYQNYLAKRKEFNQHGAELDDRIGEVNERIREADAQLEARRQAVQKDKQLAYNSAAEKAGGAAEYRRQLAKEKFGTTDAFEKAGYILPDGQMLNFAQYEATRDTDHREIMDVFGPTDVTEGTDALNKFLSEGNIRVMAEQPGIDLSASVEPTAQQLEQIREMAKTLGAEKRQFTLDFSTKDGGIAATKDYSGRIDADKIVREIREYYKTGELPAESSLARFRYQLDVDADAAEAAKTGLGNVAEQTETIQKSVEAGGNKRVSDEGLENIAKAVKSDTKSRIDVKTLTERLRGLSEYLSSAKNVNWGDAHAFMLDIAEQIMLKSSSKNDTLWKQHPELHEMGMKVEKGSTAFQELVYRYGSWANAKRELGRHGVKITQLPEGQHSRWDADFRELQELGAGLFPDEVPNSAADALEAMANAHNAIKPVLENAFDEDWEGAKQDIALQIWQRYLASPELANAESAKLRESLNQQWTEMRQQAKQEALEARAKAQLRLADKQQKNAQWASRELAKRTEQEKARRDAQIDKVRTTREADNTRRSIRRLTTQITQSLTGDKAGKNVPEYLVDKVRSVAVIANEVIGNDKALAKLGGKMNREMGNLQRGLEKQMSMSDRAGMEWQNSGIDEMVADWISDVDASRTAALSRVNKEIERAQKRLDALQQSAEKTGKDYSRDEADMKAYLAHLKMQRMEYENGGMARMTIDQLRGLREILEQTVYLVQNENKLLGEAERTELDSFATGMKSELRSAKGLNFAKGLLGNLSQKTAGYKLNTMGIQRQFERMGGYKHGGYMEKVGQMLNQGQYRRTKLLVEGTHFFDNVTGEKNLKKMDRFTHELVDIGLKTDDGRTWKITREQAVALYFQAQNMQGLHHMTHGGLKILNMEYAVKGDRERALHDAQTIRIGDLKFDDEGHILNKEGVSANEAEVMQLMGGQRTTLLAELEKVLFEGDMADYCKAWIDDYKEYGKFTKQHINETSMVLNGRAKAQVENYIPLRVDEDTRMTENTGIQYDNSVGSESFLKSRVNSSKPIWLDGIGGVVNTSLENVAQYAGMAIPLRNVQKLLNTQIDGKNINAEIRLAWGTEGSKYMEKALADLYPQKGKTADYGDRAMAKLRSAAAGAVLTANLNVTLLQAASLPTAAAELGWGSTGHAAVQFVKNVDPVNKLLSVVGLTENILKKVEAEIMEHGDVLLQYRLRGTQSGELGTMGEAKHLLGKAHDAAISGNILTRGGVKFLDAIAGSITKMDEITVAALWNGAKDYVVKNPTEFDADAQQKGSAAYWEAVNQQFQRTVERTQPNYTPMQRTGMQRSSNQALKFLMMYSTQRQQNCQIVVAAAEDRAAQARRYNEQPTAENKDALDTAKKRLRRAITSQAAAAGVISAMGIFVKYLLHRRKDLEDENGDITIESLGKRFCWGMAESLASNPVGGSEIWSTVSVVKNGSDYDALSVSGLSNLNDFIAQVSSQYKRVNKDTSEMDEAELKQYTDSVKRGYLDIVGSALSLRGVPYTNVMKIVDAAGAYWDDWVNEGTLLTTSDTPSSATGQYDRLYNAIQNGDTEEVQGATKKLAQMLKEGKIKEDKTESQLRSRLKKYDADILAAAQAQNAGKLEDRKDAKQEVFDRLCTAYGVKKQGEKGETNEDRAQRKWFIALIDKAVKEKAEELLKGGSSGSVYDQMKSALDGGTASDVQTEIDRLLKAGKESSNIKTEVTKAVSEEYLAGSDRDREKLAEMLLKLKAGDTELYEEKDFEKWVNDDEKKQEAAAGAVDEWAEVR